MTSSTASLRVPEQATQLTQTETIGIPEAGQASTDTASQEPGHSSGEVLVVAVPANRVEAYWPHVHEFVWPAFERFPGEMDIPTLLRRLLNGEGTLWVAYRDGRFLGGAITRIEDYPGFRAVQLVALGGRQFRLWKDELDKWITRYARYHHAKRLEFYGRKGWEKTLPDFEVNRIMMVREL